MENNDDIVAIIPVCTNAYLQLSGLSQNRYKSIYVCYRKRGLGKIFVPSRFRIHPKFLCNIRQNIQNFLMRHKIHGRVGDKNLNLVLGLTALTNNCLPAQQVLQLQSSQNTWEDS